MKNEGSVDIARPIDEVFRLTIDHVAEWSKVVVEDELIEEHPDGVGTTFRSVTVDPQGKRMEFRGVVTRHEPPYVHTIQLTGAMFDIEAAYAFEEVDGGTRVTQWSDVTGKGFFKFFLATFGWMMKKASCDALQKELNGLKDFCENYTEDA